jgi:ATP-dependent Lhr-like helicase
MIPTQSHLLVERFFDESGGMELVIHAPFGGRINRALGLALRKRFCRRFDFELQASADDNGIVISLGPQQSFPLETVSRMVHSGEAGDLLTQAVLAAPVFMIRWRWNTTRALAVLRYRGGKKVPPPLQRFRADDLLTAVFPEVTACPENLTNPGNIPVPDHPLIRQTLHDALHEAMDLDGLVRLLREIKTGKIRVTSVDTREPSPFSYQILNAQPYAFLDDAPLEERRARAVATRRTLTVESIRDIGKLDPMAIDQVRAEAWPLVRDPDELHDVLMLLGLLPAGEGGPWKTFFEKLTCTGRAVCATGPDGFSFWAAVERWPLVRAARPDLVPDPQPAVPEGLRRDWDVSEAETALIRGRMEVAGPVTADVLSGDLGLLKTRVESALVTLETQGTLLRGRFTPEAQTSEEWCARNLLTRIHRMTLDRLRRQIQPVPVEEYVRFLLRRHHLESDVRLHGPEGVASVIEQLQGFEIPARVWEQSILPLRISKYEPGWLDELCLNGEVAWGRIAPPESHRPEADPIAGRDKIRPATRVLPVSLMLREDLPWLRWRETAPPDPPLSHPAKLTLEVLRSHGAAFFTDLLSRTRLLPAQLEEALWELVPAGQATGDGFAALRSLITPLRKHQEEVLRRLKRRGRAVHATRRGTGRWTLLPSFGPQDSLTREERTEAWTRQLLLRYGILFRDLLAREDHAPPWHELRAVLRRLEARGEIFGGRFVSGVSGEQYGLSEAVEELRRLRRDPPEPRLLFIPAVDPLNLAGILTPGPRITATASNRVAFLGGSVVGSRQGKEIQVDGGLDAETAGRIEQVLKSGKIPA